MSTMSFEARERQRTCTIDFPRWVKVSQCERTSQTLTVPDRHGVVKLRLSWRTDYGRRMDTWRRQERLAEPGAPRPEPTHRGARHWGRRISA